MGLTKGTAIMEPKIMKEKSIKTKIKTKVI